MSTKRSNLKMKKIESIIIISLLLSVFLINDGYAQLSSSMPEIAICKFEQDENSRFEF